MNPVPADDEGQRDLERRALRNVSWLAQKLGYRDAIDRTTERWLVIAIASCVVIATAWVVVSARAKASEDEAQLERRRCEVDFRVRNYDSIRHRLMQEQPRMAPVQLGEMMEDRIHSEAVAGCAARSPAR